MITHSKIFFLPVLCSRNVIKGYFFIQTKNSRNFEWSSNVFLRQININMFGRRRIHREFSHQVRTNTLIALLVVKRGRSKRPFSLFVFCDCYIWIRSFFGAKFDWKWWYFIRIWRCLNEGVFKKIFNRGLSEFCKNEKEF